MGARYTAGMKATVKGLRAAGRRKPNQVILSDAGTEGALTLAKVGDSMELK